jgi:hypothetical protein
VAFKYVEFMFADESFVMMFPKPKRYLSGVMAGGLRRKVVAGVLPFRVE